MSFKTNWEPDRVAGRLERIIQKTGPSNIHENLTVQDDPARGGYLIRAESQNGVLHDTRVRIHVVKNPEGPGSTVHVLPTEDSYTSSQEAQSVEDTLKDRYFSNYDY